MAVITGAGGGLGRAIGLRLAADGYAIAVLEIDPSAAEVSRREIEAAGGCARAYVVDVREVDALDQAIRAADVDLGPVRALVNNAAVFPSGPFLEIGPGYL